MGKRRKTSSKKTNLTPRSSKRSSQDAEELADPSINSLPPEVLIKIFGYLSSKDRLRLEGVSKHWRLMAQKSWQTIRELWISSADDSDETNKTYLTFNDEDSLILKEEEKERVLHKMIALCGCFVKSVLLSGKIGLKSYSLIRNKCPNLVKLKLHRFETYANIKVLGPFFRKGTLLKSLSIHRCDLKMISVLRQLPVENLENFTIEVMETDCCIHDIIPLLEKFQSLRRFDFPIYPPLMRAAEMKINLNFPFTLHTNYHRHNFDNQEFFYAMDLTNLVNVYLCFMDVDDDFVIRLAATCKNLKWLDIGGNYNVTETGLNAISTLPKLVYLKVCNVDAVTDEILLKFSNIAEIDCVGCEALTTEGYIALIQSSERLRELVIGYEEEDTEKFLKAAAEIEEGRISKKVLAIGVFNAPSGLVAEFNSKPENLRVYKDFLDLSSIII